MRKIIQTPDLGEICVYYPPNSEPKACLTRCQHQGGHLLPVTDNPQQLHCPRHGWVLDLPSMTYVNPVGNIRQPELLVSEQETGKYLFGIPPQNSEGIDWTVLPVRQPLTSGEFTLRFYAHACVEISCGGLSLFTDPWLLGPAFSRGWWLKHRPPADALDRLAEADFIYISHNHSDHLNPPTLRQLAERKPDIPVLVPGFESASCTALLKRYGMTNIQRVEFRKWLPLDAHTRLMILQDTTGRDDSGFVLDYKGHQVVNTVDCANLNGGNLPKPVVLLLSSFASGASGYPICWPRQYSLEWIEQRLAKNREGELLSIVEQVELTHAACVVPFAGYFTEAHPDDAEIQAVNTKNSPQKACDRVKRAHPDTLCWVPQPGQVWDIGMQAPRTDSTLPQGELATYSPSDFQPYLSEIAESMQFDPLQRLKGLKDYFQWANWRGDLVLHVQEMSNDFQMLLREWVWDFNVGNFRLLTDPRPATPHHYQWMRVRAEVLRHVLRHGLSWEEISIGFQAHFYREPDLYRLDFWKHFQDHLPLEAPVFSALPDAKTALLTAIANQKVFRTSADTRREQRTEGGVPKST